jgi:hypothetical protein
MKPTQYQLDKLAAMNAANTAEVLALKAAAGALRPNDTAARADISRRAHKLEKNIKAAARLERELGLKKKPAATP